MRARIAIVVLCLLALTWEGAGAQVIQENKGPSEGQVTEFVKRKLPSHFSFQCLQVKSSDMTEKKAVFRCLITISPIQPLFLEATTEAIPELAEKKDLPEGVTAPTILKKAHGAREVLDVPVEATFHWMKERWEALTFEDNQRLASFGKPQSEFKLNAVVFGTTEARTAIVQFRRELAKAEAARKKSEPGGKK